MSIDIRTAAVAVIAFLLIAVVMALALLIQFLIMRAAVKSGIDRSQLAAFLRQAKLAELQAREQAEQQAEQSAQRARRQAEPRVEKLAEPAERQTDRQAEQQNRDFSGGQ